MKRIIINLDPAEKDKPFAIRRTFESILNYTESLKRDGKRITATWDSCGHLIVYHDAQKEPCIYSYDALP